MRDAAVGGARASGGGRVRRGATARWHKSACAFSGASRCRVIVCAYEAAAAAGELDGRLSRGKTRTSASAASTGTTNRPGRASNTPKPRTAATDATGIVGARQRTPRQCARTCAATMTTWSRRARRPLHLTPSHSAATPGTPSPTCTPPRTPHNRLLGSTRHGLHRDAGHRRALAGNDDVATEAAAPSRFASRSKSASFRATYSRLRRCICSSLSRRASSMVHGAHAMSGFSR